MNFSTFKETFDAVCSKDETYYYAVKKDITIIYDPELDFYNIELDGELILDGTDKQIAQAFLKTQE